MKGLEGRRLALANFQRDVDALREQMGGESLEEWIQHVDQLSQLEHELDSLVKKYELKGYYELIRKYEEAMKFKADVEKLFANTGTHSVDELRAYIGRLAEADPGRDFIVDAPVQGEIHEYADVQTQAVPEPKPE